MIQFDMDWNQQLDNVLKCFGFAFTFDEHICQMVWNHHL